jgi:uncharacterized Zn-binding protein involved in type VI secretion
MPPAARVTDPHQCNLSNGSQPHEGGPLEAPGSSTVRTAFQAQARAGDRCRCHGPPDFVVTGARTVLIDGRPAARKGDHTMHQPGGSIVGGAESVDIGGPTVGILLGNIDATDDACQAAAGGRSSGRTKQSYGNCGVEAARQIINRVRGTPITEDDLLAESIENGDAQWRDNPIKRGGTWAWSRVNILARHGVAASQQPASMQGIAQAVAERRGVITAHEVSVLWADRHTGGHAVVVTGVKYDADGQLESVTFNDTGNGTCSSQVTARVFEGSLQHGVPMVVTRDRVW